MRELTTDELQSLLADADDTLSEILPSNKENTAIQDAVGSVMPAAGAE